MQVSDRSDGRLGHLDGLNLSRTAALRAVAAALPADDVRREPLGVAAEAHLAAGLEALSAEGYESRHWLGSFAVLALDA